MKGHKSPVKMVKDFFETTMILISSGTMSYLIFMYKSKTPIAVSISVSTGEKT